MLHRPNQERLCSNNLGHIFRMQGNLERASEFHLAALTESSREGSSRKQCLALEFLGEVATEAGAFEDAERHLTRAFALAKVLATKGDLMDQEKKLEKSGLGHFFHHVEVVSEKKEKEYQKLLAHLDTKPENFLMIGNSVKSDVIPILNIGGHAFHVPYHTTWELEKVDINIENDNFRRLNTIKEVLDFIN